MPSAYAPGREAGAPDAFLDRRPRDAAGLTSWLSVLSVAVLSPFAGNIWLSTPLANGRLFLFCFVGCMLVLGIGLVSVFGFLVVFLKFNF